MKNVLKVTNLTVSLKDKKILSDVNLTINQGEIHVLMGPNGSGKSTLSLALSGHPAYTIINNSSTTINDTELLCLKPEERLLNGLFVGFQQPISVPGVKVFNFLRLAKNNLLKFRGQNIVSVLDFKKELEKHSQFLSFKSDFLGRYLNDGFSGGEKKKMEMLQALTLEPKFAIFDEIDTGLDVDALKTVAKTINLLVKNGTGVLIITHYQRILKYLKPKKIHLLINGKIEKVAGANLANEIEKQGYEKYLNK